MSTPRYLRRSSSTSSSISSSPSVGGGAQCRSKTVVVITGGSGALGSHIARLIYSHWSEVHEIRLYDRTPPDASLITSITGYATSKDKPKVSYYPGDILDNDALASTLVKVDIVIHCAAIVENGSAIARRKMKKVNVDGTQNVIQACLECGVRALVFTGSLSQVQTLPKHHRVVRYDESCEPTIEVRELTFPYYGGSKIQAENLVLLANGQEGKDGNKLHTCSLRLPVMFGEKDSQFILTGLRAAKRCCGYLVPIGLTATPGITMQSLYIGNGAWAHVLAAQKLLDPESQAEIGGKYYYIGDHSPVCSMSNFQAQFLNPLGYRILPMGIPLFFVLILAYFLEFVQLFLSFLGVDVGFILNRGTVKFVKLSHSFSWEKARKELQYEPLYSHKTALAKSMEYYRRVL